MKKKKIKNWKEFIVDLFLAALAIFIGVLMVYPMMHELFISISDPNKLGMQMGLVLHPLGFSLQGYKLLSHVQHFFTGFFNTMYVMFFGLSLNLLMTCLGAYFLSRSSADVKWRGVVVIIILITQYFSGGMIPTWLLVRDLGLLNTRWALILPGAVSTGNMILLNAYFRSVPKELEDSVRVDGGGHLTVLFRVLIPLAKAGLAVMFLYYAVDIWNSWFSAELYITKPELWPLQKVVQDLIVKEGGQMMGSGAMAAMGVSANTQEVMKAAMVVLSSLPFLIIYPFMQKYFREGLLVGSLKG